MGRSAAAARDSIEAELAAAMEAGEITDAAIAASEAQREMFWRLRETIPEAQSREGASIKHDISVTTSELPRFIVEGGAVVAQLVPGARLVSYGHLGDGNLHFNLSPARGANNQEFLRLAPQVNRAVHDPSRATEAACGGARNRSIEARRAGSLQEPGRDRVDALDRKRSIRTAS